MDLFSMNPYTVASLGVLGVPPKIGCPMHSLEPLCPTVAAVSMWLKHQRGLRNIMQLTGDMDNFLNKLEELSQPSYDKTMKGEWDSQILQINNHIDTEWKKRQMVLNDRSHPPIATDLSTPKSAVFTDVFVLALLGQSMLKHTEKIWDLAKSPKDIWCECVEHCCMPCMPQNIVEYV